MGSSLSHKEDSQQEVIVFDSERCTGCAYCMIACSFKHYGMTDFEKSHIKIIDDPQRPKRRFVGIHCIHCDDPLCLASCPVDAITKDKETGLVKINSTICIGCKACLAACPISNPSFDEERRVAVKCDFCDGDPQCVKFCTSEALTRSSREKARKRFAQC